MKYIFLSLVLLVFSCFSIEIIAQINQLLPIEIRNAYQTGTRSLTGKPGIEYWQNSSKYVINVELVSDQNLIKGNEKVTYYNNSPDSLTKLIIRLYPDLFKKGNAKDWSIGADAMTEGTSIDELRINGENIDLNNRKLVRRSATNLHVQLSEFLHPGDSIIFETSWAFDIPAERPIRTGYYGDDLYFIAYWYPQIAVYDDIDGWDRLEYLGSVEYYNDFNDYDVHIKVPGHFKVWATGSLQNETELYTKQVLKKLDEARQSDEVINIFSADDSRANKVLKNKENTWHFKAAHVSDFSFAVAKDVNWSGSSLLVDKLTGRNVFVDAVFPDSARTYDTAALWTRQSVEYMSYELPGYPFPFEHMTTFSNNRRGGGMETPMMANNGDPVRSPDAAATAFHEIAHTYFPFFMGTNERKYAWMDEGWAAYFPAGFMQKYYPGWNYFERRVQAFENFNGKERESNLMTLSYLLAGYDSYRNHAYNKSAMAYAYLHDALGDSIFKFALHGFIERWNGKHPTPYDFFNSFNSLTGQQLDWFFVPWFFEKAQADQGIKKATYDNKIVIENVGGLPLPVNVRVEYKDGSIEEFHKNTMVWSFGEPAIIIQANPEKKINIIALGSEQVPDINMNNNVLRPVYE